MTRFLTRLAGAAAALPLAACVATTPTGPAKTAFGSEVQFYPAGVIGGIHGRTRIGEGEYVTGRIALNITDRRDWGERDDEEGLGWGAGIGYRQYFDRSGKGFLWGARVDLWSIEIDWIDLPGQVGETRGQTDVLVLQPTAEIGYGFDLSAGWRGELMLGAGLEINVDEDGLPVGDGPILLLGLTLVPVF